MVAWVTGQCGIATSTAKQWVHAATRLESLPHLAEGLACGDLSLDLVASLAEVASPETDAALREASSHWSVRQARELATWHRAKEEQRTTRHGAVGDARTAPTTVETAAREFEHRTLHFNDVRRTVWAAFTRDDYALAKSALIDRVKTVKSAESRSSEPSSTGYVPYDKRLYDALMDLFRVASDPTIHEGAVPSRVPSRKGGRETTEKVTNRSGANRSTRAFRPRLVVHAPLEVLLGAASGDVVELSGVGPIPGEVARRLACDAEVVLSVEGRDGSVLDQGRARREPTVAQRIEIERRDKGCRFPGCTFSEFTDVHHVEHWVDGGETSLSNLVTLCDRHHRAVHELGWAVGGDANGALTFRSPHGRVANSVPSPTWARASPLRR